MNILILFILVWIILGIIGMKLEKKFFNSRDLYCPEFYIIYYILGGISFLITLIGLINKRIK